MFLLITQAALLSASNKNTDPLSSLDFRSVDSAMIKAFLNNYLPRHRNRVNQLLHLFGVPLTFLGTPIAILNTSTPWWPCAFFVGGYLLQFVGHAVEGNDAGEVVFLKKRLGMVYT